MAFAELRGVARGRAATHAFITRAQLGSVATTRSAGAEARSVPIVVLVPVHIQIRCAQFARDVNYARTRA